MNFLNKFKVFIVFLISFLITSCSVNASDENVQSTAIPANGTLEVHYIDVGQADCSLIKLPDGYNVLIDSGNRGDNEYITEYLKNQGVSHIDVAIGTHHHEDHIGSMRNILANFDVDKILLPEGDFDSMVYTNMLYAIEENEVEEIRPTDDYSFTLGSAQFLVIPPKSDYNGDPNNISLVCKMDYGSRSFLFTGDIEQERESDILSGGYDLNSDVLKVAHHGSRTSSSEEFLRAVSPEVAVIQVGEGNDYGLPNDETLEKLSDLGAKVYRNDYLGDIVVRTDGETIEVDYGGNNDIIEVDGGQDNGTSNIKKTETPTPESGGTESDADIPENSGVSSQESSDTDVSGACYIGNKNTKVFHSPSCGSLPNDENRVYFESREEAEESGFRGHKNCVE